MERKVEEQRCATLETGSGETRRNLRTGARVESARCEVRHRAEKIAVTSAKLSVSVVAPSQQLSRPELADGCWDTDICQRRSYTAAKGQVTWTQTLLGAPQQPHPGLVHRIRWCTCILPQRLVLKLLCIVVARSQPLASLVDVCPKKISSRPRERVQVRWPALHAQPTLLQRPWASPPAGASGSSAGPMQRSAGSRLSTRSIWTASSAYATPGLYFGVLDGAVWKNSRDTSTSLF
jgi:hypothetical protein